jgi:hypothetical protein
MNKKIFLLMFLFFLFFGCVQQTGPSSKEILNRFSIWWIKWSNVIKIGAALLISILVITWGYASIFQKEDFKAWVKLELANLLYTIIIVAFAFYAIEVIAYVATVISPYTPIWNTEIGKKWSEYVKFTCQNQNDEYFRPCHIKIAQEYLQFLSDWSEKQIIRIIRINNFISVFMSLSVSVNAQIAPFAISSVSPFIFLVPVSEVLQFSFDILMKNFAIIKAQQIGIDLVHVAFFPYLLTFGIFFRLFHFTRKLGGAMIALALSFYFVFPLMYVLWCSVIFSFTGPWEVGIKPTGFVADINLGNSDYFLYKPNPLSPDYDQACSNGNIDQGEECNEYDINSLKTDNPIILNTCPPRDSQGNILAGREKDIYCNYNNCKCQATIPEENFEVRSILEESGDEAKIKEQVKMYSDMCYGKRNENEEGALKANIKTLWNTIKEGFRIVGFGLWAGIGSENGLLHNIAKIFVFSIIAPFTSLMVALASFKVLSPLFGGDPYLAGLSRLI